MTPQYFKGTAEELKIDAAAAPIFNLLSLDKDHFRDGAFDAIDFLLMLYDEGRMPFSDRIPREAFVAFLLEAIANATFIGSHESYIFLVDRIFGAGSSVFFDPAHAPGVLKMQVSASSSVGYTFLAREFNGTSYDTFEIITAAGEELEFSGLPGIESESELVSLLSEFVPAGIYPDITLIIFATSLFAVDDGGYFTLVDDENNDIIFFEIGG